jgi:type IV pilus assembly protein PilX
MHHFNSSSAKQRGAVLIVSLILLLIMTILALSGSQIVRMQERMAGNVRDTDLAFQGAEAALRDAEDHLNGMSAWPAAFCTDPTETGCEIYEIGALRKTTTPAFDLKTESAADEGWWVTHAREYRTGAAHDLPGINRDPKYVIEKAAQICDTGEAGCTEADTLYYFRNTAQSFGGSNIADVRLESTYVRRGP